jgi:glycosyltransferase involved in cell wall biosynthesis
MKQMRILMLNYEFPPLGGGAGNACYYLLKELSDVKIDLITAGNGKIEKFSSNVTIHKLHVKKKNMHYWTFKELLVWSIKAYFYAKRFKNYDIIHAWFGWPCGVIAYMLRKPYIISLRGSDVPGYNPRLKVLDRLFFRIISRKVWKKAFRVIANSEGLRRLALKTLDCRIDVIYNGVDTEEFRPASFKNKKLTLISTGRLIERKGYQFLIPALPKDVKLQLIGDGNLKNRLKKMSKGNVEFFGKVEHSKIVEKLQKADVFVLPSLNEGMSNSVLEAMSCGLPVIVTNVGGSELVDGNGFVIPKANVSVLRKAIENFLNEPELIEKMGLRSRKIAEQMTWKKIAGEYMRVYEN